MSGLSRLFNKWTVLTSTILFWGLAFTAIKYSVNYLSPVELAALRFAIADLLFLMGIVLTGIKVSKGDLPMVFALGIFGVVIYHTALNAGEIYISSGVASLIISTAPIFVLLFSWAFLKERITKLKVLGTLIAFAGVAALSKPEAGNGDVTGILLVLLSAISAAAYTVLGKRLMGKYDSVTLTSYAMLLGSVPLLAFALPAARKVLDAADPGLLTSVLFLGVFSTYLGYQGWYYFLQREEASRASVFLLAIPLVALLAGALLLNEAITPLTVLGGIAVVLGIVLVIKS